MPWLEDLKFPRGYQMGTHKKNYGILIVDFADQELAHKIYLTNKKSQSILIRFDFLLS